MRTVPGGFSARNGTGRIQRFGVWDSSTMNRRTTRGLTCIQPSARRSGMNRG